MVQVITFGCLQSRVKKCSVVFENLLDYVDVFLLHCEFSKQAMYFM